MPKIDFQLGRRGEIKGYFLVEEDTARIRVFQSNKEEPLADIKFDPETFADEQVAESIRAAAERRNKRRKSKEAGTHIEGEGIGKAPLTRGGKPVEQ